MWNVCYVANYFYFFLFYYAKHMHLLGEHGIYMILYFAFTLHIIILLHLLQVIYTLYTVMLIFVILLVFTAKHQVPHSLTDLPFPNISFIK